MNLPRAVALLLRPLSLIYGAAALLRAWLYAQGWLKEKRLGAPVISVGNLTVGGTGKTPMVIWLAEKFLAEGKRVAVLSRGYRGTGGTSDEIELMKKRLQGRVSFGVGEDRYMEGRRLEAKGVDVFILDDGFQHLQLARDADVVLVDSTQPLRDEFVLPAGRLREPTSALQRATVVIFTRTGQSSQTVHAIQRFPGLAIYPSDTKLLGFRRHGVSERLEPLSGTVAQPAFAFCGIGNPDAFFADLQRWGVKVAGTRAFRDHHRYTKDDARALDSAAERSGAKALVTTEKDAQNIREGMFSRLPIELAVITMEIGDENQLMRGLRARLPGLPEVRG